MEMSDMGESGYAGATSRHYPSAKRGVGTTSRRNNNEQFGNHMKT